MNSNSEAKSEPQSDSGIGVSAPITTELYYEQFHQRLEDHKVPLQKRIYYFFEEADKYEKQLKSNIDAIVGAIPPPRPTAFNRIDSNYLDQLVRLILKAEDLEELGRYCDKYQSVLKKIPRSRLSPQQNNQLAHYVRELESMRSIRLNTALKNKVYLALEFGKILLGAMTYLPITNLLFVIFSYSEWVSGVAYQKIHVSFKPKSKKPHVPLLQKLKMNKGKLALGVVAAAALVYLLPTIIGVGFLAAGVGTAIYSFGKFFRKLYVRHSERSQRNKDFEALDARSHNPLNNFKKTTYAKYYSPHMPLSRAVSSQPSPTVAMDPAPDARDIRGPSIKLKEEAERLRGQTHIVKFPCSI